MSGVAQQQPAAGSSGVSALQEIIVERIRARGPMPFAAYMSHALYHPRHGYYSSGARRTGWGGDYVTSPELGPHFGALWTAALYEIWTGCGHPGRFDVVEIGAGEGTFAASVLSSAPDDLAAVLHYRIVERVPAVEERQRELLEGSANVSWSSSVAELPRVGAGCVFANEVLDNLPVHLVQKRGGRLLEVCVGETDGGLTTVLLPPSSEELERFLARAEVDLPEGHRFEVPLAAESLVRRAADSFEQGALVLVDYGAEAEALARLPQGSLACYSPAGADDRPLERPGAKDITTHVNWTAVRAACRLNDLDVSGPIPQADILRALGARSLQEKLRVAHKEAIGERRGAEAVRALSQSQALAALLDPAGLGRLGVLVAWKGISQPSFLKRLD